VIMWAKSFFGFGFDFAAESRWVYSCILGGGWEIEILERVRDSSIIKEVCSQGECRAIQQLYSHEVRGGQLLSRRELGFQKEEIQMEIKGSTENSVTIYVASLERKGN